MLRRKKEVRPKELNLVAPFVLKLRKGKVHQTIDYKDFLVEIDNKGTVLGLELLANCLLRTFMDVWFKEAKKGGKK